MNSTSLDRSRRIQIHISDSLNHQLSRAADRCGITKSAFIRVALEREFALDLQLAVECTRAEMAQKQEGKEELSQPLLFKI